MNDRTNEFIQHANELKLKVHDTVKTSGNLTCAFAMQGEEAPTQWRFQFTYSTGSGGDGDRVDFHYWTGKRIYYIKMPFISYLSFTFADLVRATQWNIKRNEEIAKLEAELKDLPKVHKRDLTTLLTKGLK